MWLIVAKLESYEGTEMVLKELLEIARLDLSDRYEAKDMASFMFLYLGRDDEAYNFIKFWLSRPDDDAHENNRDLKDCEIREGDWLTLSNQNKEEYVSPKTSYLRPKPMILALVGIKIKILQDPGLPKKTIDDQEGQIKKYLETIHQWNPTVLPALVNPKPLM